MGLSVTLGSWRWTRTACLTAFLPLALVAMTVGVLSGGRIAGQETMAAAQAPLAQSHNQALAELAFHDDHNATERVLARSLLRARGA